MLFVYPTIALLWSLWAFASSFNLDLPHHSFCLYPTSGMLTVNEKVPRTLLLIAISKNLKLLIQGMSFCRLPNAVLLPWFILYEPCAKNILVYTYFRNCTISYLSLMQNRKFILFIKFVVNYSPALVGNKHQ